MWTWHHLLQEAQAPPSTPYEPPGDQGDENARGHPGTRDPCDRRTGQGCHIGMVGDSRGHTRTSGQHVLLTWHSQCWDKGACPRSTADLPDRRARAGPQQPGAQLPSVSRNTHSQDVGSQWHRPSHSPEPPNASVWRRIRKNGLQICQAQPCLIGMTGTSRISAIAKLLEDLHL